MNLDAIVRAVQEALGVDVDGNAGLETWQAIYNRICPNAQPPAAPEDKVDDRSEKGDRHIVTGSPAVCASARDEGRGRRHHH